MKRTLLLLSFLAFTMYSSAQTVENIRVEQDGENLNIHYRIGGSTSEQLYFVTLTCSIDGGPVFEPKSVIGDVGSNIRGGKSFNTIVWDVFEDLEEIGSVEFFVKVELTSDDRASQAVSRPSKAVSTPARASDNTPAGYRKRFIGIDGTTVHPLGIRGGKINNWGWYGAFRYGGYDYYYEAYYAAMTGGVTKRIFNGEKFRLHGYAGLGVGDFFDSAEIELGFIGVIKNRVNINLGATSNQWYTDGSFGIGLVF